MRGPQPLFFILRPNPLGRKGDWKLELCPGSGGWTSPTNPEAKTNALPEIQLYNLKTDIAERTNLADTHPQVVAELKALLTQYVENGRSTPGAKQGNVGGIEWPQLWWMLTQTPEREISE